MSNIVIFGAPHSGKTTLLGYLSTAMLRHPQFNDEVLNNLKLIRKLDMRDDFRIGSPYDPINIHKDIILPSFVSLDRDELRKFIQDQENAPGSSKRLHHKQLTICMSERKEMWDDQNENENTSCTFIDLPGFQQRISDKYKGFFEGDIGLAVLDIAEVLKLVDAQKYRANSSDIQKNIDKQEKKLFEPIRIWCDYRSSAQLIIVLSKIDQELIHNGSIEDVCYQLDAIQKAINCVQTYIKTFGENRIVIPIVPISIRIIQEKNNKLKSRMKVFFRREEENIYAQPENKILPGDGTLIACLRKLLMPYVEGKNRVFSMASVDRPMRAKVNNATKTALQIRAIHGTLHDKDVVLLGPVLNKHTGKTCYTRCTIASLKADGAKQPYPMLLEGNVGGAIFKSIVDFEGRSLKQYDLNSVLPKSDIRILKSTILFTGDVVQGDIVELEIYKKEYLTVNGELDAFYVDVLRSMMPNDEIILFWYGKKILVNIIEICFQQEKLCLSLILLNKQNNLNLHFVLPCDENKKVRHYDNVLLAIPDTNYLVKPHSDETAYTYISACIRGIKNSEGHNAIWVKGNSIVNWTDILREQLHIDLSQTVENEKVRIPIKYSQEGNNLDYILARINRNLKNNFNRAFYKGVGGVEIYLEE